jgi:hypothetical protein
MSFSFPFMSIVTFCLDTKGNAKKSRLYKSMAKNQCVGRSQTQTRCAQTVVCDLTDRATDFLNAGFIMPVPATCTVQTSLY